jgi:hypothetical protein
MIYTPVEKNFRGVQPPEVLSGAWYWKVEAGKIVDFNANISKISTIGDRTFCVKIGTHAIVKVRTQIIIMSFTISQSDRLKFLQMAEMLNRSSNLAL